MRGGEEVRQCNYKITQISFIYQLSFKGKIFPFFYYKFKNNSKVCIEIKLFFIRPNDGAEFFCLVHFYDLKRGPKY